MSVLYLIIEERGAAVRITRKVFYDLAIWMVAFGLLIGFVFPFFVVLLGVPSSIAFKKIFFAACLGAGALAGFINYGLSRWVVGARLRVLADSMGKVKENLFEMTYSGDLSACTPENCMIPVDSEDEIGESSVAFNQLVESLSASMKTQVAVRTFSEMLTSQLEIGGLAENTLKQLFEHTEATGGLILYETEGELEVAASHGLRYAESVVESDHVIKALRTGLIQLIKVPEDVLVEGVLTEFRPAEVGVFPIKNKGVPLGAVVLATAKGFDGDQQARIELFMQGLGLAMNNAIVHSDLQRLAALDPLTNIYNRRFGLSRLREEFSRAVRGNSILGVMMFDIDHFKVINDTYGHLTGDRVLKNICRLARSSLREGDILFRYGGEEFVAVLPAASSDDLKNIAERLRKSIEDSSVSDGPRKVSVTISLGATAYPEHDVKDEQVLIQYADDAMYQAKELGRNRIFLV